MINIYMKDAYTHAFYGIVRETQDTHGYELPEHLESYVVMLLASYVERPNFLPNDSFAESYLNLNKRMDAKQLGDTCLFVPLKLLILFVQCIPWEEILQNKEIVF